MASTATPLNKDTKSKYDGERTNDAVDKDNANDNKPQEEEIENLGGMMRISSEYGRGHRCHLFWGIVGAAVNGCTFPLFGLLFREVTDALFGEDLVKEALRVMIMFMVVGVAGFVFTLMQYVFWGYYGSHIGVSVRKDYFWSLLRQEVGYYDTKNSGSINTEMIADCLFITEGMGIKTGFIIQQLVGFVFGFVLAFWYSWEMSLVLLACLPVIIIVGLIQGKLFAASGEKSDPFSNSGSFSNEVLVSIRSVQASPMLLLSKVNEYKSTLNAAFPIARKRATVIGFGIGAVLFGLFGVMYSIGLWYGSKLVDDKSISIGDMFGCYFSFMISGMALGQLGSVGEDISKCQIAANRLFNLKARKPKIRKPDQQYIENPIGFIKDKEATKSEDIKHLKGNITFKNVSFSYPSAPDTIVLNNISFEIEAGKTLAIVGPSGSGKSTVIGLLERFYDPKSFNDFIHDDEDEKKAERQDYGGEEAEIRIDGELIHNFDIHYLRKQIGYVSQLPLLFAESIRENIRGGDPNITDDDIINAAKFADAHEFIMKLPKQYDTNCGEMGNRLSGGQKQRIAIARAIVNKPSILLLDEATSALDTKSEREVQNAIDNISNSKSQTIVVIAHRLSTIKNADKILVIVDGEIEEVGNHQSLIEKDGVYAALVRSQQLVESQEDAPKVGGGADEEEEDGGDAAYEEPEAAANGDDEAGEGMNKEDGNDVVEDEAPPAYDEAAEYQD